MLRFEAGETSKTIAVQTIEDATAEESEAFTVQLSDPAGATVADGTGNGNDHGRRRATGAVDRRCDAGARG